MSEPAGQSRGPGHLHRVGTHGPEVERSKDEMREQFQLELFTELDYDGFKRALDESARNRLLFGFFQRILYLK